MKQNRAMPQGGAVLKWRNQKVRSTMIREELQLPQQWDSSSGETSRVGRHPKPSETLSVCFKVPDSVTEMKKQDAFGIQKVIRQLSFDNVSDGEDSDVLGCWPGGENLR